MSDKPLTFDERIGGVLAAPRRTFARLLAGEARASDVAWLLVLRLLAGELDRFARAIAVAREFGVGAAAQEILMVTRVVLPDIVGILAAGMLLQLFCRAKHAFDVAAYAWIPYLAVQLAAALAFTALRMAPSANVRTIVECAGVAWAAAAWVVALVEARKVPAPAKVQP
ncbi:MAG TPA: hypothetical protein VF997_21265 [Polyangia bacterium]